MRKKLRLFKDKQLCMEDNTLLFKSFNARPVKSTDELKNNHYPGHKSFQIESESRRLMLEGAEHSFAKGSLGMQNISERKHYQGRAQREAETLTIPVETTKTEDNLISNQPGESGFGQEYG